MHCVQYTSPSIAYAYLWHIPHTQTAYEDRIRIFEYAAEDPRFERRMNTPEHVCVCVFYVLFVSVVVYMCVCVEWGAVDYESILVFHTQRVYGEPRAELFSPIACACALIAFDCVCVCIYVCASVCVRVAKAAAR